MKSKLQSLKVTACPTSYRFQYHHLLAHWYSSRLESLHADPICTSTHPQQLAVTMSTHNSNINQTFLHEQKFIPHRPAVKMYKCQPCWGNPGDINMTSSVFPSDFSAPLRASEDLKKKKKRKKSFDRQKTQTWPVNWQPFVKYMFYSFKPMSPDWVALGTVLQRTQPTPSHILYVWLQVCGNHSTELNLHFSPPLCCGLLSPFFPSSFI